MGSNSYNKDIAHYGHAAFSLHSAARAPIPKIVATQSELRRRSSTSALPVEVPEETRGIIHYYS